MEIIKLLPGDKRWVQFLGEQEHFIFHTTAYAQFISEAFGGPYYLLGAVAEGKVQTILPIVEIKSSLFSRKIISTAYLEYGGFAGKEEGVMPILTYLNENYREQYAYLEIRGGMEERFDVPLTSASLSPQLIRKNLYKRFVLKLGVEKEVWKGIQKAKRKAIKKAQELVEVREVGAEELGAFYELYARNMQRFGSPPYSQHYFTCFYHHLVSRGMGKVFGSYYRGKLVAALLGFCYRERVHILLAVSDEDYQEHRSNDAVHWELIKWACAQGYTWFDFGRVREGSGQFEYKQKWGPALLDLPSYFLLWKAKDVPEVDPKKYALMVKVWQKLPLSLTKMVGMRIRKGLGI